MRGPAPTREEAELVTQAATGRVDQVEDGQQIEVSPLEDADLLLDRALTPRAGLHSGVVGDDGHVAAVDAADSREHTIGRVTVGQGVGQEPVLDTAALLAQ